MDRVWITNGSTSVGPVVNALAAACHEGYRPTDVYVLDNPGITDVTDAAASMIKTVVTANGGAEPTVSVETIAEERDFDAIVAYLSGAIEDARDADAEIAVDVTPGRKFWSIIGFRAGLEYDVDHLYYVHLDGDYFGESYPTIPRTAIDLVDFTEVL
ncbi:hypothetical protein [Halovivax sp.]|uniref:hypothetical protein n=1 Tax=Halovivax sp. TaxID=1935978 RepID=UPI0025C11E8F|nr:hypothetical protein [Halovivax sp.]